MNNNSDCICLIPARGGSKRLPRKNIRLFNGKPLIAWSIETAISCNLFSEVYVSSDDNEIIEISRKYGADIPFVRPAQFANDHAKDIEVINHFLEWVQKKNLNPKFLCYLYPTAPFIEKKTLSGCLNLLKEKQVREVSTITSFPYPPQKAFRLDKEKGLTFNWEEYRGKRSQDLETLYHDAGQCYFFNLDKTLKNKEKLGYKLPRYKCQDIDTLEDFENLEILFRLREI